VTKRAFRVVIQRRTSDGWKLVAWEPRQDVDVGETFKGGMSIGRWQSLELSPDGSTLLGDWTTECEANYAFFIPAAGGRPRPVTGESDTTFRTKAPVSGAHGWAPDGRARVFVVGDTGCGGRPWRSGEYLIDPGTGDAEFQHS